MNNWENLHETSLSDNEDFSSHINMEYITDADYVHAKRIWKNFQTKNVGAYHYLYVQRDTLLVADIFENFWKICLKI